MNTLAFNEDKAGRDKVWSLIKDIRITQMVTQNAEGGLFARPMSAVECDENGDLWFFTALDSTKVAEIDYNPHVLLSYSNPDDNNYVSISGTAEIVRDHGKIQELWAEPVRIWFPEGPEDPNLALICVHADSAEYWDAPSRSFVYAYGYVRQRLTGKAPKTGEHGKVDLH